MCRSYNLIGSKTKVTFTNQMHTLREERSGSQLHERRLEEGVETLLDRKLPPEGTRATDVRALNTFLLESSIFFACLLACFLAGESLLFLFSRFVFAFIRNGSEKEILLVFNNKVKGEVLFRSGNWRNYETLESKVVLIMETRGFRLKFGRKGVKLFD